MKDPFEAALEEQQQSPPESPAPPDDEPLEDDAEVVVPQAPSSASTPIPSSSSSAAATAGGGGGGGGVGGGPVGRGKEEEEDEDEEENMDVEIGRITSSSGDPDKMAKMQAILSQFTEEQMSRYESFRRSGFQKSNMKRMLMKRTLPILTKRSWPLSKLLVSITGSQKISVPMTIVASGIAKMFVGELVENARVVMTERNDSGPIRPCHIREAYRRLKLEGKVPRRSVPRLFR